MSKNIKECNIYAYECLWTGKNKKEIERFFKLYDFDKYSLIEDDKENLLYIDRLVETNSIIIGNKQFGIIGIFQNEWIDKRTKKRAITVLKEQRGLISSS